MVENILTISLIVAFLSTGGITLTLWAIAAEKIEV
jgi:hypothetical protein